MACFPTWVSVDSPSLQGMCDWLNDDYWRSDLGFFKGWIESQYLYPSMVWMYTMFTLEGFFEELSRKRKSGKSGDFFGSSYQQIILKSAVDFTVQT